MQHRFDQSGDGFREFAIKTTHGNHTPISRNTKFASNFNQDFEHKQITLDEITLDCRRSRTTLHRIKQKEDH